MSLNKPHREDVPEMPNRLGIAGIEFIEYATSHQVFVRDRPQFVMRDITAKIASIGFVGDALHGGATWIVRMVCPPALEPEGMRQCLGKVTFHGAGVPLP